MNIKHLLFTMIIFIAGSSEKALIGTSQNQINTTYLERIIITSNKQKQFEITKKAIQQQSTTNCQGKIENTKEQRTRKYIGECMGKYGKVNVFIEKTNTSKVLCKLNNKEKVTLLETLPYGWFLISLKDGTKGYVDARDIRANEIPPHEYIETAEGYVLVFYEKEQKLRIYKKGKLVLESTGSSGLHKSPTPKGIFQIEDGRRGKWGYVPAFNSGFKYWVGFRGNYLFHSIPYNEDMKLLKDEAEKLGHPASHGCIRLPVDASKYIYENVPAGSLVLIY